VGTPVADDGEVTDVVGGGAVVMLGLEEGVRGGSVAGVVGEVVVLVVGGVVVPVSVLVVDVAGPAGSGSAAAAVDVSATATSTAVAPPAMTRNATRRRLLWTIVDPLRWRWVPTR
ncbi:MAG: hypothetical protein ACHP7G_02425, partial [Actinomycetales bacterium]